MNANTSQVLYRQRGRRMLLGILLGIVALLGACAASIRADVPNLSSDDTMLRHKYRGIHGGILYIDATGYRKQYVTMQTQSGQMWRATWNIGTGAQQSTYTDSMYIPKSIRVVWRTGDVREKRDEKGHTNYSVMGFEGGTIVGDYTVPVAERIPDDVLDYIRSNGGALRLKIRLKDDGVLIGWDVEEWYTTQYGRGLRWVRPGGDFREAQIRDGKVIDPGWQK